MVLSRSKSDVSHEAILEIIEYYTEIFGVYPFLNGGCGVMFRLLHSHFPEARPYYDSDHVITRINNRYYDATGEVEIGNHILLETGFVSLICYGKILEFGLRYEQWLPNLYPDNQHGLDYHAFGRPPGIGFPARNMPDMATRYAAINTYRAY